MLNPTWLWLSVIALVGGVTVILVPKRVMQLNDQLNKILVSVDGLLMRYRHLVGVALLVVAYLCFRLALLVPASQ